MRKIEQRHGNMEWTDSCRRGGGREEWKKEREGTIQRTCMNVSWTWTTERALTVGERGGLGRGGQKGKVGTTVIE